MNQPVVPTRGTLTFTVDGVAATVADDGSSLLETLRDRLGVRSVKDGCAPQGQCGCCTVLVDGQPRVACVTPASRVNGRSITTVTGLPEAERWAEALVATGGTQCGFCTPGIIVRLSASSSDTSNALLAHLCRCTGWQTIKEAADLVASGSPCDLGGRDLEAAARRASIEGGTPQVVGPQVALGDVAFGDDDAPADALVAIRDANGDWVVGETLAQARKLAGRVQGRRSTVSLTWPLEVPAGEWSRTLRTTWVEPAYLEPDASWCAPGGEPSSVLANGGAFGGKRSSTLPAVAKRLADEYQRPVRAVATREDVVRFGPKRPPIAAGVRSDGTGVIRVARTAGVAAAIASVAPGIVVEEVDLEPTSLTTSTEIRGAGWVEAAVLLASVGDRDRVVSPEGAEAEATVAADGTITVSVRCGEILDEVVLRSYCIAAAHQALGWVRSEGIALDEHGEPADLTIRSFGIVRAVDMAPVVVHLESADGPPVNGSDAVFAAVASAVWRAHGFCPMWPDR